MAQTKSLEETLQEIEEIISRMDQEEISLEESFQLYNNGIKLCKQCNDKIDKVEKQLEVIGGQAEE
ncbi:MAG: exodeoxyribonuclease VII small subunit [Lachnospiraceae bacterium]|nr:exodeoxyribonuclease VII small subunit [Lachnospiraceae bacterium]